MNAARAIKKPCIGLYYCKIQHISNQLGKGKWDILHSNSSDLANRLNKYEYLLNHIELLSYELGYLYNVLITF